MRARDELARAAVAVAEKNDVIAGLGERQDGRRDGRHAAREEDGIIGPLDFRGSETGRLISSWLRPGLHPIIDGTFDFVDVRDVARGLALLGERGAPGEVYIIGNRRVSLREMFALVQRETGQHSPALVLPYFVARAGAPLAAAMAKLRGRTPQFTRYSLETLETSCDIDHGKIAALGYQPRPVEETMRDIVRWWRERPIAAADGAGARARPFASPAPARIPKAARQLPSSPERVAVVTGASSGIGAATARRLAAAGFRVVLVARREERLEDLAREIRAAGWPEADPLAVDLSHPEGPRQVYEHVMDRYHGLDLLVNNAGFGWYGYASDMPWLTAQDMLQVNNAAVVQLSVLFLPVMRRVDRGHIVNVSSVAGSLPSQGVALYCATKSFLDAFSTALYRELRDTRVRVSVVKPGPVLTEFYRTAARMPGGGTVPAERFGVDADTVAAAIMHLVAHPRRTRYVPGLLRLMPWVEFSFGWLIDRMGPLLLRRRAMRA